MVLPYTGPAGPRILVATANPLTAIPVEMLLARDGHAVHVVPDGPSVLEAVESYDPDVVLVDSSVPGRDGHEVARQLKARNAWKTPLLIAIADGPCPADTGIDLNLVKPVDPVLLRRLLKRFQRAVG
jgi:CheY-like chemotaxis protein